MHDHLPTAPPRVLAQRADLLRRTRAFFDERGFIEVETPLLSADTVVDRHIDPFSVDVVLGGQPRRMWLQTSPEFGMKRLLAGGMRAIYQVTRAFRRDERGARHNPEFTILEWYRAGDDMAAAIELLSALVEGLLGRGAAERLSYAEAFARHAGVDAHRAPVEQLAEALGRAKVSIPESMSRSDRDAWLDLVLVECVEPHLGVARPTILYDYPATQAALARTRREGDVDVAERFELYVDGVELANGYHELLDAEALAERNRANNRRRAADGKAELPEESRLLAAMRHGLPPCAGVALGFDRMVMLASGQRDIAQVIPFPFERA